MKAIYLSIVLSLSLTLAYPAAGGPAFSGAPGYIALPLVTVSGDSATWTSGIQGFDGDDENTVYLFGENRYILQHQPST